MDKEKVTINEFIRRLERGRVLYSSSKIKGVSYFNSNLSILIDKFLSNSRKIFINKGYIFLQLPVFVKGEDFLNQCKKIKDFSKRVFWGDPLKNNDSHVFNSTIEAQITSLLLVDRDLLRSGNKFAFIRQIGRYESGKTIPFWKERLVSFFVEAQTLHSNSDDLNKIIDEMNNILKETYDYLLMKAFFVERFRDNRRLGEYSERRLESVAMDSSGNFSILSSIYDLGDSFSKAFDLMIGKDYPLMINFAYSARLFLLMLINHSDKIGLLYPTVLADNKISLMLIDGYCQLDRNKIVDCLVDSNISFCKYYVSRDKWKDEFAKKKTKGIPLIIVLKKDGSWLYQRITNSIIRFKKIDDLNRIDIRVLIKEHDKILKQRQVKMVESGTYLYNNVGFDNLSSIKKQIVITGLCNNISCFNKTQKILNRWDIMGHLLEQHPKVSRCICCGKKSFYSILLGKKVKTEK